MSGQDMRKIMEMAMGQGFVFVVSYGGVPVKASMESELAENYAEAYREVSATDPTGPKEVIVTKVDLYGE